MHTFAKNLSIALAAPLALMAGAHRAAAADDLASFGVLAGSTVTNTGASVITGNVGVSPGNAITGFPPGLVVDGVIYTSGGVVEQAQSDLTTQFTTLNGQPPSNNLTSTNLGGLTLTSGVYKFDDSAQLTGQLTLDAQGNPNSRFVFVIGSTLTTASASQINLINAAQGGNVYFIVGSSATLGTDTEFAGQILALTSITLNNGANINCGAALARNGAVTLDTNTISICVLDQATIGDVLDTITAGTGGNQNSVGSAIDSYVSGGGVLPAEFQNLIAFLSPTELDDALSQLSGEIGTSVAPAGMQATTSFLSQVFSELNDGSEGQYAPQSEPVPDQAPGPNAPATVKTLGYGPDEAQTTGSVPGLTAFDRTSSPDPRRWNAWVAAYGDRTTADGSFTDGTHDLTMDSAGVSAGLDYRITPDTRVGFALSGGRSNFDLADGLGDGRSNVTQAAIYGRTNLDAAYLAGALSFGHYDVKTDRTLTFDGGDHLSSSFSAYDVAGRVEAGYRFSIPETTILSGATGLTPYAALQVQSFHTPSYSEPSDSGTSPFALNYDANTTTSVHTELGAKVDHVIALQDATVLTLRGRIAWAHDTGQNSDMQASFQGLPGSSFTVAGVEYGSDALLLSAGAEIKLKGGFAVSGLLDSRFASTWKSYAATARLSYGW
ncbi:ice-binding family protein [Mesorhizobium sp. ES1-1]|uniref:ice-binding family protein n=1 Tax=Mesorhizobium sp. ES1-1 TaxID=2876629 RepID=UPI001CCD0CC9|nr:ice-binding family protein [Mesorhizobium sp. ES1-1]MBZ9675508.1 ice-binding family protein [Mesorhizobium sp. ES1-1]